MRNKATKKDLIGVLGTLLAECNGVKTHYGSEFYKARKRALIIYRKALKG